MEQAKFPGTRNPPEFSCNTGAEVGKQGTGVSGKTIKVGREGRD